MDHTNRTLVHRALRRDPLAAAIPTSLTILASLTLLVPPLQAQEDQEGEQQQVAVAGEAQPQGDGMVDLETWDYDQLASGWRADELLDADVIGPEGDDIGSVENLFINDQGEIVALIAQVGGFLDIGDTHIAVPWDEVEVRSYDEVHIPVTEENIEEYSVFSEDYFSNVNVGNIEQVDDDVTTGPDIFKATDLLDDQVLLNTGEGYAYVTDLIFVDDTLASIVVDASNPTLGYGTYAYPWLGYRYGGWSPGLGYYTLPYGVNDVGVLDPFDYGLLNDDPFI